MALWKLDTAHTEIKFKARHLVVSTVTGYFNKFEGTVDASRPDFTDAKIRFEADVTSISTNNQQRDTHLKSADFFDAGQYPTMTFVSSSIEKLSDQKYKVTGDLTIRGTTRRITLDVTFNGIVRGLGGVETAGFEITGKVNRFDFGLRWNALTEAGGIVVGEEITIDINAEIQKAADQKQPVRRDTRQKEKTNAGR